MLVLTNHDQEVKTIPASSFDESRLFRGDDDYRNKLGVYESVRTYDGKPFCLEQHLKRLEASARAMRWEISSRVIGFIREWVAKIIDTSHDKNQFLRITATNKSIVIISRELYINPSLYREGVSAITTPFPVVRHHPSIKGVAEREQLKKIRTIAESQDSYECLLVNTLRHITEGTRSNVLWVRCGTLYWCPYALLGITQSVVLELAKHQSIPIPTQRIYQGGLAISDLRYIDELFLTTTSAGVIPITTVNGKEIGNGDIGPVTQQLMEKFNALTAA